MGSKLDQAIAKVVETAEAHPQQAGRVYSEAAARFRRAANDPRRGKFAPVLRDVADTFDAAARPAETQFAAADEAAGGGGASGGGSGLPPGGGEPPGGEEVQVAVTPASAAGSLTGNTIRVKYAPTQEEINDGIQQQGNVLLWQDKKQKAQALTIDAGLIKGETPAPLGSAYNSCRPYGIVEYGTDGYRNTVPFDIGFGTRFTVAGNYVSVSVGMDPPLAGFAQGLMTLGASLGFYAAPSAAPVTRTAYCDNVAVGPGAFVDVIRPAKAVALLPPQSVWPIAPIPAWWLRFVDWGGTVAYELKFGPGDIVCPITLTNDIARVLVYNVTPSVPGFTANLRLPFQLAL